jgi:hypothetical protein
VLNRRAAPASVSGASLFRAARWTRRTSSWRSRGPPSSDFDRMVCKVRDRPLLAPRPRNHGEFELQDEVAGSTPLVYFDNSARRNGASCGDVPASRRYSVMSASVSFACCGSFVLLPADLAGERIDGFGSCLALLSSTLPSKSRVILSRSHTAVRLPSSASAAACSRSRGDSQQGDTRRTPQGSKTGRRCGFQWSDSQQEAEA